MSRRIVISYRRQDEPAFAQRLRQLLAKHFRAEFTTESAFPQAGSVDEKVAAQLRDADVVLVVIGPRWLRLEGGRQWMDDPDDWTRHELVLANAFGVPVLPVLVDDTPFPRPDRLPQELRWLAERQSVLVRRTQQQRDVDRLVSVLEHILESPKRLPAEVADDDGGLRGAVDTRDIEELRAHVAQFPDAPSSAAARARIHELEWREARAADTEDALSTFVAAYPDHRYAARARSRLATLVRERERREAASRKPPRVIPLWWLRTAGGLSLATGFALPWLASFAGLLDGASNNEVVQLRPELVWLPEGTFVMGSLDGVGDSDEGPQRTVQVAAFAMCRTEVTQAQWASVMKNVEGADVAPSNPDYGIGETHPVQGVSWFDAVDYLNALSAAEGLEPCYSRSGESVEWDLACDGYRLPTEAEWEYAARAGTTTRWSWGDEASVAGQYAWFDGNAESTTHPVQVLEPNPWSLYDLHGNVWEWVWDGYDENAYGRVGSVDTVVVWSDTIVSPDDVPFRVLRGGSFLNSPVGLRSAFRLRLGPVLRFRYVGFRCVRSPPARPSTP